MTERFDTKVKRALRSWPSCPTNLWPASRPDGHWLRAQPKDGTPTGPRLMAVGTTSFRTQPDGLWVFVSADGFADCIAIEACGTAQNFSDKRARYFPSGTSTMLECTAAWLNASIKVKNTTRARWTLGHGFDAAASGDKQLPVRFLRVLFFLRHDLYARWRECGVPAAHEFVASYASVNSYTAQSMQSFLKRMAISQHFYGH